MPDPLKDGKDSNLQDTDDLDLSFLEEGNPNPAEKDSSKANAGKTPNFRILPQFSNLPEKEGIIRTAQSAITKLSTEVNRLHAVVEETQKYKGLMEMLEKDSNYRRAFLKELDPDLFKENPKNVKEMVKAKLKEEFPDFQPDVNEAGIYGSPTYDYNRRAQELEKELSKGTVEIPELKSLLEERKNKAKAGKEAIERQIDNLKQRYGWDNTVIQGMFRTFNSLSVDNMGILYNLMLKKKGFKAPVNLGGGKNTNESSSDAESYVAKLLGDPISGPSTWK